MKESTLQQVCIRIAKRNGWRAFKWVSPGHRGVPDYIFLKGPPLRMIFVEFKQQGQKPTLIQQYMHRLLRAMGAQVEVIDDTDTARRVFGNAT